MKSTAILTTTLGLALGSLHAQTVPPFINYQGKVTDSAGTGLGTGTPVNRKVIFRIFDAATAGTRLWSEQHTVTISNGEFSVLLGNGINANYAGADETPLKTTTPLDTVFTSAGILRYVEIVVDNGDNALNAADAPIAPRQQITSTAYSFRARSADTIASGTDLQLNSSPNYGLGYYGSTRLFNGAAIDGPVLFGQAGGALGSANGGTKNIALRWNAAGAVGVGSADLSGAAATTKLVLQGDDANAAPMQLNIRGNSDTNKRLLLGYNTTSNYGSIQAYSGTAAATNLLLNPSGGNVGIGTTLTPSKLTIASFGNDYGLTIVGASTSPGLTMQNNNPGGQRFSMFVGSTNPGSVQGLSIFDENALAYRFVVKSDGNVGIGTTSPTQKLTVAGGYADISGLRLGGQDAANTIYHPTSDISINTHSGNQSVKIGSNVSGTAMTIKSSSVGIGTSSPSQKLHVNGTAVFTGNVGIGTTAPTKGRLEISGRSGSTTIGAYSELRASSTPVTYYPTYSGSLGEVSVYASDFIAASGYIAFSDERIKQVEGRSDASMDLATLMGIEVTDYTYIDTVAKGTGKYKKVIAQQVEKVFPQAVMRSTDEIPDIFQKAGVEDGWIILKTNLKKGERVRILDLQSSVTENNDTVHEVVEIADGKFRTNSSPKGDEVFVYGREVKDFRSVDYEALSMLNVSATQQIKQEKDAEVKALQEENSALRDRIAALEAKDLARDAQISSIEKRLAADLPAARTVSLKQGE